MSHWLDERHRYDALTLRVLWVTIALSCLIHLSALVLWQARPNLLGPGVDEGDRVSDRLRVRLAAIQEPEPAPKPLPESITPAKPLARPPKPLLRTQPLPLLTPPVPTTPMIAAPAPPVPAIPPVATGRASPPVEGDLWSYVQARRRERGEQQTALTADAKPGPNAALAANLPSAAPGVAARDKTRGGGIFEIKRMDYDDAAFEFFGWNNEMGRNTPQLIEVRKGNNSDMRIAVVRKMIAIIRIYSQGDFVWRSPRHENGVVLSARPSDNAALENFLMRDFFNDPRQLP